MLFEVALFVAERSLREVAIVWFRAAHEPGRCRPFVNPYHAWGNVRENTNARNPSTSKRKNRVPLAFVDLEVEFVVRFESTKARMFVVEQTHPHTSHFGGVPEKERIVLHRTNSVSSAA